MKKWFALLTALLCLLTGSALATFPGYGEGPDTLFICGQMIKIETDANQKMDWYWYVNENGMITKVKPKNVTETNYNVQVYFDKGANACTVIFKNVTTTYTDGPILKYTSGLNSLTVIGEGTNQLTTNGSSDVFRMEDEKERGKDLEIKGNFETLSAKSANAIYKESGTIRISGTIQKLGSADTDYGIRAKDSNIKISGHIGSIEAKKAALFSESRSKRNIQIDGTIGSMKVNAGDGNGFGIYAENSKVKINNSVGPITVSGKGNSNSAVRANDIELGEGISLVAPKNGSFVFQADGYTHVVNADGAVSPNAQFGKAAAPTDSSSAPKTGDDMNLALWAILLALSIIGVSALSRKEKKVH